MSKIRNSLQNFSTFDSYSQQESFIHSVHPLALLLCTLLFIGFIASFGRYEIIRLIPYFLYPAVLFSLSGIPVLPIVKRAALVLPVVLGVCIFNLIFDKNTVNIGGVFIYGGFASMVCLLIKYALTVSAALLMIATTGIHKLSYAMRLVKVPRLLVLQITLTYRYISVLSEEVLNTLLAYRLRAVSYKGVKFNAWGALAGQMLLRTYDRAQQVYRAMCLRGFNGDYCPGANITLKFRDFEYFFLWVLFFTAIRLFDVLTLIGLGLKGVF